MWRQICQQWLGSSRIRKMAILLMLLTLTPPVLLVINRIGVEFDTQAPPYQNMDMIYQLVHGKILYAPLSTEYNCVTYAPLYWYLCAIPCWLFGMSFFWPRLISLLAAIGCGVILFAWIWRLTERNLPLSVAAPVIFFWIYQLFIEVNVNLVQYFFTLFGFYLFTNITRRNTILAAIALSAAFFAKQTALAYIVAAMVMLLFRDRRQVFIFLGVTLVVVGGGIWYLETFEGDFFLQTFQANTGLPWMWKRVFSEVIQYYLATSGFLLIFSLFRLLLDDQYDRRSLVQRIWKSEYVMTAAGIGVGIISSPKLGSGVPTHCIIGVCGLIICGLTGLHQVAKLLKAPYAERLCIGVILAQVVAIILLSVPTYPFLFIDRYDREKNANIANVFKAGRTCFFGIPYIQRQYGQPSAGIPDDEPTKWKKGKLTYAFIPDELSLPFKKQEFDYVIIGSYFDPAHPVVKAIMENYKTTIGRFPAHPKYPRMFDMRFDCYVLKANRLVSGQPSHSPVK